MPTSTLSTVRQRDLEQLPDPPAGGGSTELGAVALVQQQCKVDELTQLLEGLPRPRVREHDERVVLRARREEALDRQRARLRGSLQLLEARCGLPGGPVRVPVELQRQRHARTHERAELVEVVVGLVVHRDPRTDDLPEPGLHETGFHLLHVLHQHVDVAQLAQRRLRISAPPPRGP